MFKLAPPSREAVTTSRTCADFVEVKKTDILAMHNYPKKGFSSTQLSTLTGNYRNGSLVYPGRGNGACPSGGGRINGVPTNATDTKKYFYKGLNDDSDCIDFFIKLGLI